MSDFVNNIIKNSVNQIKYRQTIVNGEITSINSDGTYDVKIAQASSAFPNIESVLYGEEFTVGEIVDIAYEYGNKEAPKIIGHAKKIAQEPVAVEVDYSGEEAGGKQTKTVVIYGNMADGTIWHDSINYETCQKAELGTTIKDTDDFMGIGYVYENVADPPLGWGHAIFRSFLFFDTSVIPQNATIINAYLKGVWGPDLSQIDTEYDIVIQNGQPIYPHNPLVLGDYNKNYYSNNGGSINTQILEDALPNVDFSITLNSNGRAWINKGSMTKLCLRSSRDIAGLSWDVFEEGHREGIAIFTTEKGEGFIPNLEITYEY